MGSRLVLRVGTALPLQRIRPGCNGTNAEGKNRFFLRFESIEDSGIWIRRAKFPPLFARRFLAPQNLRQRKPDRLKRPDSSLQGQTTLEPGIVKTNFARPFPIVRSPGGGTNLFLRC